MYQDLKKARQLLTGSEYTCVLCKGSEVLTRTARGVRPLVDLLRERRFPGFCAADRVIGKATAFLYVLLGVRAVYTPVASESAVRVLRFYGIEVFNDQTVPAIFNRSRTGFCPMETAVMEIEDPIQARMVIEETLQTLLHRQT